MSATAALQSQITRLDALLDRKLAAQEAEQARADSDLESARRAKAKADHEACVEIGSRYADAFRSFNVEVPMPVDGQAPIAFRKMLFNRIVRRLPEANEWARTRADDIPLGPAMDSIEALVLQSAQQEGERPSFENLPDIGMVMRTRTDANTGTKYNEFYSKQSFIADMGRPGRQVERIVDRRSNSVIWGKPLSQA